MFLEMLLECFWNALQKGSKFFWSGMVWGWSQLDLAASYFLDFLWSSWSWQGPPSYSLTLTPRLSVKICKKNRCSGKSVRETLFDYLEHPVRPLSEVTYYLSMVKFRSVLPGLWYPQGPF